jgi:hypothetical protein
MTTNALAGIAVKDLSAAVDWYERLLDRAPDAQPMREVAEWRFSKGGWIQVFEDADRAGHSSVTLVEENLDKRLSDLKAKAIEVQSTSEAESVKTAIIADPDGNQLVFAQAKRRGREFVLTSTSPSSLDE